MRYWIVTTVCRLLWHPTRKVRKEGVVQHECPCGHMLYSERPGG